MDNPQPSVIRNRQVHYKYYNNILLEVNKIIFKVEQWKTVKYNKIPEGLYSVSTLGNVKNNNTGRILKQSLDYDEYKLVTLSTRDGKGGHKTVRVNRLVALHFIDNPENKPMVNHINSDRADNNFINLEWVTAKENTHHGIEYGNFRGRKRKYNDESVHDICRLLSKGYTIKHIASELNLDKSGTYFVSDIKNRRTRTNESAEYNF